MHICISNPSKSTYITSMLHGFRSLQKETGGGSTLHTHFIEPHFRLQDSRPLSISRGPSLRHPHITAFVCGATIRILLQRYCSSRGAGFVLQKGVHKVLRLRPKRVGMAAVGNNNSPGQAIPNTNAAPNSQTPGHPSFRRYALPDLQEKWNTDVRREDSAHRGLAR